MTESTADRVRAREAEVVLSYGDPDSVLGDVMMFAQMDDELAMDRDLAIQARVRRQTDTLVPGVSRARESWSVAVSIPDPTTILDGPPCRYCLESGTHLCAARIESAREHNGDQVNVRLKLAVDDYIAALHASLALMVDVTPKENSHRRAMLARIGELAAAAEAAELAGLGSGETE